MEAMNSVLFGLINGSDQSPQYLQFLGFIGANAAPFIALLVIAIYWVVAHDKRGPTRVVIRAVVAATLGLGVNQVIGWLWFHPRPFMIGLGHQLITHAPDSSFPSDHATLIFSMALAFMLDGPTRIWAAILMVVGLFCAWARVFAGIHFPIDMAGSLLVACAVVLPASLATQTGIHYALPFLSRIGLGGAPTTDRASGQ